MEITAHTMEYRGGPVRSSLRLENYSDADFDEYRRIYNDSFREMRIALGRFPLDCCAERGELERRREQIYVLRREGELIGSVALYGNEIDDLIVSKSCRRMGYGQALLRFALAALQEKQIAPITLHVADWNQGAVRLYLKNGFSIVKTETV